MEEFDDFDLEDSESGTELIVGVDYLDLAEELIALKDFIDREVDFTFALAQLKKQYRIDSLQFNPGQDRPSLHERFRVMLDQANPAGRRFALAKAVSEVDRQFIEVISSMLADRGNVSILYLRDVDQKHYLNFDEVRLDEEVHPLADNGSRFKYYLRGSPVNVPFRPAVIGGV